jgi:hypothetical protein
LTSVAARDEFAGTVFIVLVEEPCMDPARSEALMVLVRRSFASRSR